MPCPALPPLLQPFFSSVKEPLNWANSERKGNTLQCMHNRFFRSCTLGGKRCERRFKNSHSEDRADTEPGYWRRSPGLWKCHLEALPFSGPPHPDACMPWSARRPSLHVHLIGTRRNGHSIKSSDLDGGKAGPAAVLLRHMRPHPCPNV